ncbi:hypothetical protein GCM10010435_92760 [Winogradskya consettensis]|uniref:Uncharacterized protein n=1 Tax=Winogradskya consettensis TaxID=113560 RepID=A0A919VPD4_9ACTN|nr:hypothetical protein Aco04nite_24190 [Actinoplanes consettensis]
MDGEHGLAPALAGGQPVIGNRGDLPLRHQAALPIEVVSVTAAGRNAVVADGRNAVVADGRGAEVAATDGRGAVVAVGDGRGAVVRGTAGIRRPFRSGW